MKNAAHTVIDKMALFSTESAFHTEFDSVWVDRTKSNSVRPKCSSHVIPFPQLKESYYIKM